MIPTSMLRVWVVAFSLVMLAGCGPEAPEPPRPEAPRPRLLVLSLDGLPWDLACRKMAEGKMPHLAELVGRGASAEGSVSAFPAKTAPGHATLWTGRWADGHGILGNQTPSRPRTRSTILDVTSGFEGSALQAEPIWRIAARAGLQVTVVQATQADPMVPDEQALPGLTIFTGFRGLELPALVTEEMFSVGGQTFHAERSGDGLDVSCGDVHVQVRPGSFASVDHPAVGGVFYLYLARLDDTGWTLLRSSYSRIGATTPELEARFRREVGGYAYNSTKLGETIWDGSAWKKDLYLAAARLNVERVRDATLWALREFPADLTITYLPQPDEALHTLLGRVELEGDREAEAVLDGVLELCDGLVGRLAEAMGEDGAIAVVSDHGMAPVDRVFYPNLALERAGLLTRTPSGEVDLSRTQALFSPCGGDFVVINTRDRRAGIESVDTLATWTDLAERAIREHADIALGPGALGPALYPKNNTADFAVGREGDIHFPVVVGEHGLSAILSPELLDPRSPVSRRIPPIGYHSGDPRFPRMHAVMIFAGRGFRHATRPGVRHIDFAPTVLHWLGLAPLPTMNGHILRDFLESP